MKIFRKVLLYAAAALAVVTLSMVISAFLFKEKIIKQFIASANEKLSTPVKIGKIDVSVFQHFPSLSIVLTDVYVEDSHSGIYPLLTASRVSFQLNPIAVYRGIYSIRGLEVADSETTLRISASGENNYTVLKDSGEGKATAIGFELKNIQLKNSHVRFVDVQQQQDFTFSSEQLAASIQSAGERYWIEAVGELTTNQLMIKNSMLFEDKSFVIETRLVYDDPNRLLTIEPSELSLKNSDFTVKGSYQWKETPVIDLQLAGNNTNLQTLLSLLPEKIVSRFERYQSKGDAYFSASLKGVATKSKNPSLSVEFGLQRATLVHPETKTEIRDASVEGSFASSNVTNLSQGALVLKNITGKLNDQAFEANLVMQDLNDPDVIFNFKGLMDAASWFSFYPMENISSLTGQLQVDVSFQGKPQWLKDKATAQQASTAGSIEMHNLNFTVGESQLPVTGLNGLLQFNNNDMALSNVSVNVGNSDFLFNGFFKNVVTFLLFEHQPIGIEADLKSSFLDVDQLFAIGFGVSEEQSHEYEFSISPAVNLNFNCDVRSLRYKRFQAQHLKGDLLVKNQIAVSRNINLNTMGGNLTLSGIVDAKNHKAIDVLTSAKLDGIHIDSVFYVFNNFGQSFIEDKHLKGQAVADVTFELTLNEKLRLFKETLIADISATIKKGELNNFEPVLQLNRYLDDEGLHHVKFADLKNDIHIENKTVYIPQMEVRTNVTALQISGTHTFDQHIDYRVVTPLRNKNKINTTEAGQALEEQGGQLKLYLKITGTTDDYKVQYDGEAVRKKIASDLKKEVQELKDAFKTKGKKKKKELELSTEEFDWDN